MHDDLVLLAEVDRQDRVVDRIRKDKQAADASVTDGRAAVKAAEAELERLKGELAASNQQLREHQRSIETYEARRTSAQRVLEGGGGDPEAAQRQLDAVADILDDLETKVLEGMERAEALAEAIQAAETAIEEAKAAKQHAEDEHPRTIAALKAEYATAKAARDKAFGELDRATQSKYEAVRQRKGRAVATIENESCKACRRVVQPKHLADLQRGLIEPCRGCGRWLIPPG